MKSHRPLDADKGQARKALWKGRTRPAVEHLTYQLRLIALNPLVVRSAAHFTYQLLARSRTELAFAQLRTWLADVCSVPN